LTKLLKGLAVAAIVICLGAPLVSALQVQEEFGDERRGEHPIPQRFGQTNLWLSASRLTTRTGGLSLGEFPRLQRNFGERLLAALDEPTDECVGFTGGSYDHAGSVESFQQIVEIAEAIFRGTVTGIDGGFWRENIPGLLIQIEVTEWIKRESDYPQETVIYFFYPEGNFWLGDLKICASQPHWPEPPHVSDEVLLFPQGGTPFPNLAMVAGNGVEVVTGNVAGIRAASNLLEIEEFRSAVSVDDLVQRMLRTVRAQSQVDGAGR
jgi:hypothetical protein